MYCRVLLRPRAGTHESEITLALRFPRPQLHGGDGGGLFPPLTEIYFEFVDAMINTRHPEGRYISTSLNPLSLSPVHYALTHARGDTFIDSTDTQTRSHRRIRHAPTHARTQLNARNQSVQQAYIQIHTSHTLSHTDTHFSFSLLFTE